MAGVRRQAINKAIKELVDWKYIEKQSQQKSGECFCLYRTTIDDPGAEEVSAKADTPTEGGVSAQPDTSVRSMRTPVSPLRTPKERSVDHVEEIATASGGESLFAEGAGTQLVPFSSTDAASILELGRVAAFREKHGIGESKQLPFTASVLHEIALLGVPLEALVERYFEKTKGKNIKDPSAYVLKMGREEAAKALGVTTETLKQIATKDPSDRAEAFAAAVGVKREPPPWMKRMEANRDRSALANTDFIRGAGRRIDARATASTTSSAACGTIALSQRVPSIAAGSHEQAAIDWIEHPERRQ